MNRIFISYRSSDGKKDADRLCADLSRRLGEEQVFFDKQDLRGGSSWREAIHATLGRRPLVLLLITPDLFGADHPDGGRRIDREDDPIRNELLTAQHSGAVIVPLLTEGMPMPSADSVPEPLRFIHEVHALKLRTDDWARDVERILEDLRGYGIQPDETPAEAPPHPTVRPTVQPLVGPTVRAQLWQKPNRLVLIAGGSVALMALMALGFILTEEGPSTAAATDQETTFAPAELNAQALATPPAVGTPLDISGVWWSVDEAQRRTRVVLTTNGRNVQLQTDPVPVSWYPDWEAYALKLREQGMSLTDLSYRGAGTFSDSHLQMRYEVYSGEGEGPLDTGSLTLSAGADGRELTGLLWSNGEQASKLLRLVRNP